MAATTSQGTGAGAADKPSINELATLVNVGPNIIFAGSVESGAALSSPPAQLGVVVFPYTLAGDSSEYVILLTTINGGYAYVAAVNESEDGFRGFTCLAESECTVMYMVASVGTRPQL